MQAIESIREQKSDNKWKELTHILNQKSEQIKEKNSEKLSNELYKKITLDILHIEKLDEILKSDAIQLVADKKQELILEKDELRIKVANNFLIHLVTQEDLSLEQQVDNFWLGIECICTTLIHSGEVLYLLDKQRIVFLIRNLHTALKSWKNMSQRIENESIWLVHEKSLKSIYSSLYILEDSYRYLVTSRNERENYDDNNNWMKEDERYKNLLKDMKEWSKEEWSEEEQKTFEKAMSNLS